MKFSGQCLDNSTEKKKSIVFVTEEKKCIDQSEHFRMALDKWT